MSQQFCLKWNNHMNNMMDVFKNLLSTEAMVDVTLACDGLSLKAHKIVLSACSPFFQSLFLENPCKHPIVILKDMKYTELKAIIEFMYHGEVNVAQDQLSALMKTAETLRVKGLAEVTNEKSSSGALQDDSTHRSVPRTDTPPPKRKKARTRKRSLSDSNRSEDESNEPSIVGRPDSPEIEELSNDVTMDNTQYSNMQSQVPTQILPSHPSNSFHKTIDSVDDSASIDDSFVQEEKFRVEPAKLLEQTLTTDDLPSRRSGRSSVQSNLEMQRRPRSSTDHSTSLVHASMSNEALGSNQQPESPPDIKPELLELDPPLSSPVAGPSHGTDDSMMMYMDPGPSGYQDNSQALVPADNQQQELILGTGAFLKCKSEPAREATFQGFVTDMFSEESNSQVGVFRSKFQRCSSSSDLIVFESQNQSGDVSEYAHPVLSLESITTLKAYICDVCGKGFNHKGNYRSHCRIHTGEKPFQCKHCDYKSAQLSGLLQHKLRHNHEN